MAAATGNLQKSEQEKMIRELQSIATQGLPKSKTTEDDAGIAAAALAGLGIELDSEFFGG